METINFMIEKEKRRIIDKIKTKKVLEETSLMLNDLSEVIKENEKDQHSINFMETGVKTVQEMIFAIFNERIDIKKTETTKENEEMTTISISYKGIEIADLQVIKRIEQN